MSTTEQDIHPTSKGYHNKNTTDNYVKGRPGYSKEVFQYIKETFPQLTKDSVIVDLAAGTGKFTELLVSEGGFRNVIAIEPSKEFRDACTEVLEKQGLGDTLKYQVLEGTSTRMPLPDASVDMLCIAQAFHWFSNEDSLKEISRVLKSGAILFMVWNDMDVNVPWIKQLTDVFHEKYYDGFTPQYRSGKWKQVFETLKQRNDNSLVKYNLNHAAFVNPHVASHESIYNRVFSTSYISILPQDKKDILRGEIEHVLKTNPEVANKDTFILPYNVDIYWTTK
ncbi:putative SAM dependent methyltransferase [Tieghemostelium lacteum]|uniref:Putative SAM dependent methyltransferase n=1 Tax=Tieghemostelium lacteum TaxID=361077 RepID=A0A151Z8Q2_TIELA|nr:putative SAM dependent methyltransferase [Tieghemostelium lacteum]|eukprot:KYQ90307.1 putative SAM dependent methyltransferase [Tieghemostelium lacteum]